MQLRTESLKKFGLARIRTDLSDTPTNQRSTPTKGARKTTAGNTPVDKAAPCVSAFVYLSDYLTCLMSMISFKLPSAAPGVTRAGGDSGPVASVKNNNQLKSVQCNELKQMDALNIKKRSRL